MKNILKLITLSSFLMLSSCNFITQKFGGSMTVELEKDQKLVNCSWKSDSALWILTRNRKEDEPLETYKYVEKSVYGILEGTVTLIEK